MPLTLKPVEAGHGSRWVGDAFRLFARRPMAFTLLALAYFVLAMLMRLLPLLGALLPLASAAQIAVSVNDNKMVLDNGVPKVAANPQPDTVAIIDMKTMPPRLIDEIEAPASVAGPPLSVAVAPDETIALVTSAMKVSPTDPSKVVLLTFFIRCI